MTGWDVLSRLRDEWSVVDREIRSLRAIFHQTDHNMSPKSIGTIILLLVWSTVYVGAAFELITSLPPMFIEFTVLVFLVLGRWWGVELVYHSLGEIEAERRQKADRRNDDGGGG